MQPPTKCCAGAALAYASAMVCREVTCLPAARAGAASEVAAISVIAKAFSWAICFSPYVREADKGLAFQEARDEQLLIGHSKMRPNAVNAPGDRRYARSSQGERMTLRTTFRDRPSSRQIA